MARQPAVAAAGTAGLRPPRRAAAARHSTPVPSSRGDDAGAAAALAFMDPEVLINEVYARPPLWDRSSPAHSNRDVVAALWKEVADACNISCDLAKSKWKHLRDHFRCELKRCMKSRSGSSGRYRSSWVWFWPLVFLKEQMLSSRGRDGRDSPVEDDVSAPGVGDETHGTGDTASSIAATAANIKLEPGVDPRPCKRRRTDSFERDFLDIDRRNLLLLEDHPPSSIQPTPSHPPPLPPYDDTDHFLLSLAPAIRTLPLTKQMMVRLKVQELVTKEVISAAEACPSQEAVVDDLGGPNVVETALEIQDIEQNWPPDGDVPDPAQAPWGDAAAAK